MDFDGVDYIILGLIIFMVVFLFVQLIRPGGF